MNVAIFNSLVIIITLSLLYVWVEVILFIKRKCGDLINLLFTIIVICGLISYGTLNTPTTYERIKDENGLIKEFHIKFK